MFRLNQRVCRVEWRNGLPYVRVAKVAKTTSRTYYVDGDDSPAIGWHEGPAAAIEAEYMALFSVWDTIFGARAKNWKVRHTVICVCRLRRLEVKLKRLHKHSGEHQPKSPAH